MVDILNNIKVFLTECTDELLAISVIICTLGVNSIQIIRGLEPVFPWEAAFMVLAFYFGKKSH